MQHLCGTFSPSKWRLICAYVHHIAPKCAVPRKMLRPSPFGYVAGIAVTRRVATSYGACSTKRHIVDSVHTAMRRLKLIVGVGGSGSACCWRTSATALGAPVKLIRAASIGGFAVLDSLRFLFCGLGQLLRSCRLRMLAAYLAESPSGAQHSPRAASAHSRHHFNSLRTSICSLVAASAWSSPWQGCNRSPSFLVMHLPFPKPDD